MALLLPKGIVVNNPELNLSIERINNEPLDLADIARFWKVYTTTKRRLLDPTAERLENYWWRIWGSRSRELKGATVARLFAHISEGQSFVPLRGPHNRDEGTPSLEREGRHGHGASSTTAIYQPKQSRPSTTSSSAASRAPVVMPHPILKTTRGPSATGPRPTARFISPHESEDETGDDASVSPNSHVVVQPPSPTCQDLKPDKKMTSRKKAGFIASRTTKKKRPVLAKRQSSQSSTDNSVKISDPTIQSPTENIPPASTLQGGSHSKQPVQSKFQENFPPASGPSPSTSTSVGRKSRPSDSKLLSPRKSTPRHQKLPPRVIEEPPSGLVLCGDPGPSSSKLHPIENNLVLTEELTVEELEEIEVQRMLLEEANARVQKKPRATAQVAPVVKHDGGFQILHKSLRSRFDGAHDSNMGAMRLLPHDAKGTASAAPTLADATGQLDLGKGKAAALQPTLVHSTSRKKDKGKGRDSDVVPQSNMFAKRPVQPVLTASVLAGSLARSKSQLTMLLERDQANSTENKSKDEKGNSKKG